MHFVSLQSVWLKWTLCHCHGTVRPRPYSRGSVPWIKEPCFQTRNDRTVQTAKCLNIDLQQVYCKDKLFLSNCVALLNSSHDWNCLIWAPVPCHGPGSERWQKNTFFFRKGRLREKKRDFNDLNYIEHFGYALFQCGQVSICGSREYSDVNHNRVFIVPCRFFTAKVTVLLLNGILH